MNCWTCKRSKEELQSQGLDPEFEEFEIEGKDFYVCSICNTLIELIAEGEDEEGVDEEDDEIPEAAPVQPQQSPNF